MSIPVYELPAGTGAIKVTIQRLNGTGTVWVDDVRCEEGVSRKEDKSYYYHCDYLGSPRVMTDPLGNVIWRQDYYAFGGDYNTSATGNTHKFTGHVQDAATGQYYAKARYFTTNNGRWSQPEPLLKGVPSKAFLANPQILNPYVYCLNNPIKYSDPDGKNPLVVVGGAAIIGIGVDYAMQWKASGKTFGEFYKSGQYSLGRGLIVGGASAATAGSGTVIAGGQGTLIAKMLAFGATSSIIDVGKKLFLGQKPDPKASALVGATNAGTMAVGAGVDAIIDKAIPKNMPENSTMKAGAETLLEIPQNIIENKIEEKTTEENKDDKEEK